MSGASAQYEHFRGLVHACVNVIPMRVSGQRVCVASDRAAPATEMKTTKAFGDKLEPLPAHPVLDLLSTPNQLMSGSAMLQVTVASLELTGRALLWITLDEENHVIILPIPVSWIVNVPSTRTRILGFEIRYPHAEKTITIPADQAVYLRYPDPSSPWGHVSPLAAMADAVMCDAKISDAQYKVFERGPWPSHALVVGPQPVPPGASGPAMRPHLTPEQRQQLVTAFTAAYSGTVALGKPIILDGMIERVEKLSLSPNEMAFLQSAKLTKERILMVRHE